MEITTLIENTRKDERLIEEFGLSLLIKTKNRNILFDTGASGNFIKNASVLGIDMQDIDFTVVSHAHYDHAGGLQPFFDMNQSAKAYLGKTADQDYYVSISAKTPTLLNLFVSPFISRSKAFSKYIGIDKNIFKNYLDRIIFVHDFMEIDTNIFLIGDIKKHYPLAEGNKFLLAAKEKQLDLDDFKHEILLVIMDDDGLVLFTGCGHSGLLNMIETVRLKLGDIPIKTIIGGFHLKLKVHEDSLAGRKEDIEFIADELIRHKIEKVYTGHCTGNKAYNILKSKLKNRINRLYTGLKIKI